MDRPAPPPLPAHPDVLIESDERVWNGRFPLDRVKFRNRKFDGSFSGTRTWELWRRGRAAAMLPYDPMRDTVVLIEQFRLPALAAGLDPVLIEVPAGLCDPGETEEATIRREIVEEAGVTARRVLPISKIILTPGGADETCALFVGEVDAPASGGITGLASENEDIRVLVWPAERACAAAIDGKIGNSVTAIALLWLALRRGWLRKEWS